MCGSVGELHKNTVVCWVRDSWRVEMAFRWKIDKGETDGIQSSEMIFLSAEHEGCEIAPVRSISSLR